MFNITKTLQSSAPFYARPNQNSMFKLSISFLTYIVCTKLYIALHAILLQDEFNSIDSNVFSFNERLLMERKPTDNHKKILNID